MIKTYLFTREGIEEDVPLDDWRSLVEGECKLLWVDLRSLTREEIEGLAERFGLHTIEVDSCLNAFHRPHLYEFEDHFYLNLTVVKKSRDVHGFKPSELHVFAGRNFIVTATRDADSDAVDKALEELRSSPALACRGAIHAVYLLAEDLVETYYPLVEKLDDEADALEDDMLDRADKGSMRRLQLLKRRAFELRRLLGPQRDIFNGLSRRDFPFMTGENQVFFQDVYSRMIRLFDMLDTVREILSGTMDIYLSSVSNRLNEVVKVLTIASIMLMTLSFVTGFYGMNFVHLPWLRAPSAFRNILVLMAGIVLAMFVWFKRKRWL